MAQASIVREVGAFPNSGIAAESPRNQVLERLRDAKREAIEAELGKGESWATKLINGESGVRLADLPALLTALGLKVVGAQKICVNPDIARAYEVIVARATQARQLLEEDAE